jgi:predicted DNA-binding ribbon-helix-helix protein
MQSSVIKKRSIIITRHKTSISLEDEFWESLREIAKGRGEPISQLIADIDEGRQFANLSSAIRLFVLRHYCNQVDQQDRTIIPIAPINGNSIEVC